MSQPPKIPRDKLLILAFAYGLGVGYDPEHPPPFPLGPLIDAFGKGLRFGHDGEDIVVDAPKWITMHPNGKDAKGQHVQIETTTGEVLCGLGEENKGKTLEEINGKPKPASTGSSGGPVSVGFSELKPAVVADIKRKNLNSLSVAQSRHLNEALSALCDPNWDAQAAEPQLKFKDRDQQRRFDFGRIRRDKRDIFGQIMVRCQHPPGSPAQNRAADIHQYGELIHDLDDDGAAKDNNGYRYEHPKDEQSPVIARNTDNAQYVIQTHECIG